MTTTLTQKPVAVVDLSSSRNSSEALQKLEAYLTHVNAKNLPTPRAPIGLHTGGLVLTSALLSKIRLMLEKTQIALDTIYSTVPQTQQAALDEHFFVREAPPTPYLDVANPLGTFTGAPGPRSFSDSIDLPFVQVAEKASPGFERMAQQAEAALNQTIEEAVSKTPALPKLADSAITAAPVAPDLVTELVIPEASVPNIPVEIPENSHQTLYIKQNLRSGQSIRYEGNLVIIGDLHAGSEVIAGGDITVWGELRGIAHAGADFNKTGGNYFAEIRAMKIEALQLRIADFIARKPDRVIYHKRSDESAAPTVAPEVARVADGEIKVFKDVVGK